MATEDLEGGENFEAAFARMSLDEPAELKSAQTAQDKPAAAAPAEPAAPTPAEPAAPAAPAPAEPVQAELPLDGGDPADPAKPAAPAAPKEPAAPADDDAVLARLANLVNRQPAPVAPEPEPTPAAPAAPIYTDEETAFLQDYAKEWPDVAKAEELRRRGEYQQLVGYVFREFQQHFAPVAELVQQLAQHTQLTQLQTTIPDYGDVREQVFDWVEKQPTYLQVAYKHVINNGTVDEVADLVNRFKAENGITSQAAAPASTETPTPTTAPKKATELPTATKQAAAALAPVSSKRTAVVTQADPMDFESAFSQFANM